MTSPGLSEVAFLVLICTAGLELASMLQKAFTISNDSTIFLYPCKLLSMPTEEMLRNDGERIYIWLVIGVSEDMKAVCKKSREFLQISTKQDQIREENKGRV